ncbi:phosphotransferase [Paenibacillus sp. LHD-38]|uniref:phosphotransferase n=1 Tax=Paenibacillus sp. LHD-38 TaxID=3072143 RepID=UPI00280E06B6|nr:phosphotransferase [Paenibacillus sp. LHD-38]MDQ8733704.1 phosphotransferase [Paenibacillus sp. LHD-38]
MTVSIDFSSYLNEYEFPGPCLIENLESGMNNTTRIISSGDKRFVLRIYNNHKDTEIVRLEQEILAALLQEELPFRIPIPVQNKRGDTITIASDGKLSSLFHYIDGERPTSSKPAHVYALGATAAKLTRALALIRPDRKAQYSPYYMLEETYASMNGNTFLAMADHSEALSARKASFLALQEERQRLIEGCAELEQWPKQWIHGDLVFNNTVSQDDRIIGVLDFEFATMDVRAMELAVIAVDLIKPNNDALHEKVGHLLKGFQDTNPLTEQELKKLPLLMKLRLLDVALHFAVRLRDQLDHEDVLCEIIDQSAFGCKWINEHWEDEWV